MHLNRYGQCFFSCVTFGPGFFAGVLFYSTVSLFGSFPDYVLPFPGLQAVQLTAYEYIDGLPLVGVAMYRIKSVDTDGQYNYSKVVSVSENNNAAFLQVLNNPAHEAIYKNIITNNHNLL